MEATNPPSYGATPERRVYGELTAEDQASTPLLAGDGTGGLRRPVRRYNIPALVTVAATAVALAVFGTTHWHQTGVSEGVVDLNSGKHSASSHHSHHSGSSRKTHKTHTTTHSKTHKSHHSEEAAKSADEDTPPHILFVMLDDVGINDMGDQSTDIKLASDFVHSLGSKGVTLTRYYTEHSCTPGRTVVLTGRYTFTTGMQYDMVYQDSRWGLSSNYTTMGEALQELGYYTAIYGKWDVGHYAKPMWPTNQGFDHFFGLLQTNFNYNLHTCCNDNNTGWATDLHYNYANADNSSYYDYYSVNLFGESAANLIYSTYESGSGTPLFIYWPCNAIHAPVYLPENYTSSDEYAYINEKLGVTYEPRALFTNVMKIIDDNVQKMVTALKATDFYDSSVIIFTSDNGAPTRDFGGENGGSAYPFRGGKGTMFEGGLRVPAMIVSPLLPMKRQGVQLDGLFHGTDWLPTLVEGVAGGQADYADGINQWDYLMGTQDYTMRREIPTSMCYVDAVGGLIYLNETDAGAKLYKLMYEPCVLWYNVDGTVFFHNETAFEGSYNTSTGECSDDDYRLYELYSDPYEVHNLYYKDEYADVLAAMSEKFCNWYNSDVFVASANRGRSAQEMGDAYAANDWFLTYWEEEEVVDDWKYSPMEDNWKDSPFCPPTGFGQPSANSPTSGTVPAVPRGDDSKADTPWWATKP